MPPRTECSRNFLKEKDEIFEIKVKNASFDVEIYLKNYKMLENWRLELAKILYTYYILISTN